MNPIITLSSSPEGELTRVIRTGLDAFTDAFAGAQDRVPLSVVARASEGGDIVGGIRAGTAFGLLTISLVYLPEAFRGAGVGTRMMEMVEQEARRRGCRARVAPR
ncbi:GNAT family N-acetyltransferase [Bradyrhizobium jicamae]|uniref:GNAT family N-acetyltransferase n=1 Tax=Bradyrhizobium jicamae TaxID=280332 RepID=UPI001BA7772D|nr:GNAT family N-acetyltransferase [Bradyrhizobium jicamae]MBR0758463.1 GNAT family N-acetyltransferase [Bradyrhizobium jicamae]